MIERIIQVDERLIHALRTRGMDYFNEAKLPGTFKVDTFLSSWSSILAAGYGAMWRYQSGTDIAGLMGAIIAPDLNDAEVTATEMFLYVLPEYRERGFGIRLINNFISWARDIGATRIMMAHVLGDQNAFIDHFTQRGFVQAGVILVKELT